MLVMSKASWDRLSPADRVLVRQAAKESVPHMRALWDISVAEAEAEVARSDVAVNQVDKDPFRALMRPVWAQFIVTPEQRRVVDRIREIGEA
jgi:TRAP-type C4-dicarboxylate transport system substrate-binding protein